MAGPFSFGEAELLTFTQRGGESLKDAWYRINDSQKRATKKQSTTILLRNFYVGITSWNVDWTSWSTCHCVYAL